MDIICENCDQSDSSTMLRPHGFNECAPCYLASLDHGRQHVVDGDTPSFVVVVGFMTVDANGRERHIYTQTFDTTSTDDALALADRDCGHVVDRFAVQWTHISRDDSTT